eukprot:CAMPEP_0196658124 /NCGR_PEP_ID=MMETSP1086-20130531/27434_1 /TAXON_ID=77921 /ORGANISM="Cyanoptyche  gloeocystis , Strain SAG4.97" /LENGTH=169 /DNA_ID=CAMNT_0041991551 /DNA_START=281 /DNA_END=790 /DNA_ORIENTATION=+
MLIGWFWRRAPSPDDGPLKRIAEARKLVDALHSESFILKGEVGQPRDVRALIKTCLQLDDRATKIQIMLDGITGSDNVKRLRKVEILRSQAVHDEVDRIKSELEALLSPVTESSDNPATGNQTTEGQPIDSHSTEVQGTGTQPADMQPTESQIAPSALTPAPSEVAMSS